ncbi:MAG: homocitrate synthase [Anaerolineales bacterium]|nr:homocitrate synthase [Anaerolineales bacterium]
MNSKNKIFITEFKIIESTLREGEQFAGASLTTGDKLEIAQALDEFGVEYLELSSPVVSPQSYNDIQAICGLGLKAKILTHIRCNKKDAESAMSLPLDGLDIVIGASALLQQFSHGKNIPQIIELAINVLSFIKKERPDLEIRFSTEDTFRSSDDDLFEIYRQIDQLNIDRVGIADTVGIATPFQVYSLVSELRKTVRANIEFHGHNDSGCAIANSLAALNAGATHIDTSILGIGERNGITSLGGLIARLYTVSPGLVQKYNLKRLYFLDELVAGKVQVDIPFNNYITGITAFTHKAGIHTKAILNHPGTYEALNPEDFGLDRHISVAHTLTGRHAIGWRARQLGFQLTDERIREITAYVKTRAGEQQFTAHDVDSIIEQWASDPKVIQPGAVPEISG